MDNERSYTGLRYVADTPLAQWLNARIGARSLRKVGAESGVQASLLSTYLAGTNVPNLSTVRRLAVYFRVPEAEIEAMIPETRKRGYGWGWPGSPPAQTSPNLAAEVAHRVVSELQGYIGTPSDENKVVAEQTISAIDPDTLVKVARAMYTTQVWEGLTPRAQAGLIEFAKMVAQISEDAQREKPA